MGPRNRGQVDRFAILIVSWHSVPLVITEAVLYTNDDPVQRPLVRNCGRIQGRLECGTAGTYHRLVKTTPNPKATKKSKGELVGPPPPPPEADVVGPGGPDEVAVGDDMADDVEG